MTTRPVEDIEMRERNRVEDVIREQRAREGETSSTDRRRENPIIDLNDVPNARKNTRGMKRAFTEDKKDFISKNLKLSINKKDAEILYKNLFITRDGGATYKGVKVLVNINGKVIYNPDLALKAAVDEFKGLIDGLRATHLNTAAGYIEKQAAEQIGVEQSEVDDETSEEVLERTDDRLEEEIQTLTDKVVLDMTENELRELEGALNPARYNAVEALDIQADHWKELAEKTSNKNLKNRYETISQIAELKADLIRLRNNQIPKSARVLEIMLDEIRTNDLTRFQRFRKWARENMGGLAAVAISIGGIITTIVMAGRKAIRLGAKGLSSLAKSVVQLGKKLGPVIGAVLKLVGNVLSLGAKGISFLANNLWLLAVLFASYILAKGARSVYNKREWLPKRKS